MTRSKRGRKPVEDQPCTEIVRLRVTSAQRLALRRIATDNGQGGMSGVIREAVNEYVSDYDEKHPFRRRS